MIGTRKKRIRTGKTLVSAVRISISIRPFLAATIRELISDVCERGRVIHAN